MTFFKNLRMAYGNMKLQTKLSILIFTAVAVPMTILAMTLTGLLLRMLTADTLQREQRAASRTAPLLEASLDRISSLSAEIGSLHFSRELFHGSSRLPLEEALTAQERAAFEDSCQSIIRDSPVTGFRIYIDLPRQDPVLQDLPKNSLFSSADQIRSSYWYGIITNSKSTGLFCPPFYLGGDQEKQLGDCAYIRQVNAHDTAGNIITCYLACYFSSSDIRDILNQHLSLENSVSYITNERDALVATTDDRLSGIYYMDYDKIRRNLMSSNGFLEKEVLDETVYVGYYYIPDANWFLVTVIPSRPLIHATNLIWLRLILTWAASAVLSILLSIWISHSISRRIQVVSRQMSQVKTGPPIPLDSPFYEDEIGDLIDSYNYMARKINDLMLRQQKAAEELRISEFKSLQAQINPHFLYNTMDMINWMAQQGRTEETSHAIRDLSRFYKLTLSRQSPICRLEEEIEHGTIYIRLQNMRFDNRIDFVVDIPDSLLDYQIPRLTLQPVLENAILHGILEKDSRRGTIVLTGWIEDKSLLLLVSDDGVGMPPSKLTGILSGRLQDQRGQRGSHIAVYNTHRRLQILYGPQYGLHYESREGEGTDVEIRLPACTRDSMQKDRVDGPQTF